MFLSQMIQTCNIETVKCPNVKLSEINNHLRHKDAKHSENGEIKEEIVLYLQSMVTNII